MNDPQEGEALDTRRRRLRFRSHHRGTLEADLLMGAFADTHLAGFTSEQLDRYEVLLDANDSDLLAWVFRRKEVPPEHDHDVTDLLLKFEFRPRTS